jgi:serine/threonine protein kinase/tetratricopeptide (TPR) repeat protein
MNEETLFHQALQQPDAAARAAFLDQACADQPELRARLDKLLEAHDAPASLLNKPAVEAATSDEVSAGRWIDPGGSLSPSEGPGTRIGSYKLLQQIGEGGMGVVYMAEQEQPVRRKVALKIIKPGMDSRQVIARFEAERQALAMMDHQNIARVLDAGTTDSGRPYFVMELVKGVPITKFCDDNHLTPRERLELFVPVCQAIQHAHQKGIIHRDIKPSNVLVTLYDGKPVPKVIDFGVAKAIEQRLTERTLFTQIGQVVGTLEYMSPEQAEINALDIDTRSDIYSLGVLLYELLTGSTPLEKQKLRSAAFTEMLRMIREEEPPKPSTRLSASRDQLVSISAQRKTEPAKLTKLMRGELDWIVMKALEKDRGRRYETASGFARDIERYLADEPVEACPPSAGYKLQKFARKNRKPLVMAGAFVLLLAAAALVSTWQAFRATRAEMKARQAQTLAEERFDLAKEAVDKYLNEVTEDPELKGVNLETLRKKLLETAVPFYQKLAEQAPGDAVQESAIGQAYLRLASIRADLGQRAAAVQDYERARDIFARLSAELPNTVEYRSYLAESHRRLANQLAGLGKLAEAEAEFRTAIEDHQRLVDEYPNDADHRQRLAESYTGLGGVSSYQRKRVDSEAEYRTALEGFERLTEEHPNVPMYRLQLAQTRRALADLRNDPHEAEAQYRAAIKELQRLADEHPNVPFYRCELALDHCGLGNTLDGRSRPLEAEAEFRAAIKELQRLADEHPRVPDYRQGLAICHNQLGLQLAEASGKPTEAEAEYRIAIKERQALLREHPEFHQYRESLFHYHNSLGIVLIAQGKRAEAEAVYRTALKDAQFLVDARPNIPPYWKDLADCHSTLGDLLVDLGKPVDAGSEFRSALRIWQRLEAQHANDPNFRSELALIEGDWAELLATSSDPKLRDPREAVVHAKKAVELDPRHDRLWKVLGVAHYREGDWNAAIEAFLKSAQLSKGDDSYGFFFLAMAHWQLGERDKARTWYDRAVDWMDKNSPKNEELKRFRAEATALLGVEKAAETPKKKE